MSQFGFAYGRVAVVGQCAIHDCDGTGYAVYRTRLNAGGAGNVIARLRPGIGPGDAARPDRQSCLA